MKILFCFVVSFLGSFLVLIDIKQSTYYRIEMFAFGIDDTWYNFIVNGPGYFVGVILFICFYLISLIFVSQLQSLLKI